MTRPTSEHRKMTRLESSVAEILRQHYPEGGWASEQDDWLELVGDFVKLFKLGNLRFDDEAFWDACLGENSDARVPAGVIVSESP